MRVCTVVIAGAALAVLACGSADAATRKPPPRKPVRRVQTLTFAYNASQSAHTLAGPGGQLCVSAAALPQAQPCFDVNPASWVKYMTITSKDATGQPVPISLWGAGTGVNTNGTETFVCAKTQDMPVGRGDAWSLSVDLVSVEPTCPGPISSGTVTVRLSNLP
jgi:hypothetical protein